MTKDANKVTTIVTTQPTLIVSTNFKNSLTATNAPLSQHIPHIHIIPQETSTYPRLNNKYCQYSQIIPRIPLRAHTELKQSKIHRPYLIPPDSSPPSVEMSKYNVWLWQQAYISPMIVYYLLYLNLMTAVEANSLIHSDTGQAQYYRYLVKRNDKEI